MNSTQNKKIEQVKETTMIVGIDVGSEKHYFRAFSWRGIELTGKPVAFSNSMEGFNSFYNSSSILKEEDKQVMDARILLAKKTAFVLKEGLELLGIKTVNRM